MKTLAELDHMLVAQLNPLVAKLTTDGPIRWLAYLRLCVRMLRRWTADDYRLCGVLESKYGGPACNEALAILLGNAGVLDTDGVYSWARQ